MVNQKLSIPEPTDYSYTKMTGDIYDAIYGFKKYKDEANKLINLIKAYKKTSGNKLLDVACGTGAHLQYFIEYFSITGIDLSGQQLSVARKRLPTLRFIQGDMREFQSKMKYDVVICLFSSIGYVHPISEMEKAIYNMAQHLEKGGLLIVEPWLPPGVYDPTTPPYVQKGTTRDGRKVTRTTYSIGVKDNLSIMRMHNVVVGPNDTEEFTEQHELASYYEKDYKKAYEKAGLEFYVDEEGLIGRGVYIGVKY